MPSSSSDRADIRREPLIQRKALLERALACAEPGLRFNEDLDNEDGRLFSSVPASWAWKESSSVAICLPFCAVQGMDQGEESGAPRRAAHPRRDVVSLMVGCLADTGGIRMTAEPDGAGCGLALWRA
jgi:hypothetical protein